MLLKLGTGVFSRTETAMVPFGCVALTKEDGPLMNRSKCISVALGNSRWGASDSGDENSDGGVSGGLFDQFELNNLGPLKNSYIVHIIGLIITIVLFRGHKVIPKRWQAAMESIYNHFGELVKDNSGAKYFPFVLTLFIFIVCLNVLGLFPYVFTVTAHVVVTLGLSCSIIMGVTKGGLSKFK